MGQSQRRLFLVGAGASKAGCHSMYLTHFLAACRCLSVRIRTFRVLLSSSLKLLMYCTRCKPVLQHFAIQVLCISTLTSILPLPAHQTLNLCRPLPLQISLLGNTHTHTQITELRSLMHMMSRTQVESFLQSFRTASPILIVYLPEILSHLRKSISVAKIVYRTRTLRSWNLLLDRVVLVTRGLYLENSSQKARLIASM